MTKIMGLACPYGRPNRYNETLLPFAFKNIKAPLPLRFKHIPNQLGEWTNLTETNEGLYVEGNIDPMMVEFIKQYPEIRWLSVGYRTNRRLFENSNGGKYLMEALAKVDDEEALTKTMKTRYPNISDFKKDTNFDDCPRRIRQIIFDEDSMPYTKVGAESIEGLGEISLTDKPAYDGTWFKLI